MEDVISNILPSWVQPAIYIFLGLMVLEIAVQIWSTISRRATNQKLDEVFAKVGLIFLIMKSQIPTRNDEEFYTEEIERFDDNG